MQATISPELSTPTIPPMRTHVSLLSSDRIDLLVSQHIFKQSPICHGHLVQVNASPRTLRCTECQALIVETTAMRTFEHTGGHTREAPCFSTDMAHAWSIVDRLRSYDEATQTLFALYLDQLVRAEHTMRRPSVVYSKLWYTMGLSPRVISVAALQAVEVVDAQGYLVESEVA